MRRRHPRSRRRARGAQSPDGPLSPRESAVGAWTGREVLVFGGSDAPPCHPSAGCRPTKIRPLRDGAAYDPRTRSWRSIADAPVGIEWARNGVAVGRTVYVLVPGNSTRPGAPRAFLGYSPKRDRWRRLRPPRLARRSDDYELVAAGRRLVAYGPGPARIYRRRTDTWSKLPADPLTPADARQMVWSGHRLISLACTSKDPAAGGPCLVRAAALDLETGAWERLPDSGQHFLGVWYRAGDRLVNPTFGTSDGGETNGWHRAYPNGGILDLRTRTWSELPDPPSTRDWVAGGVLTATGIQHDYTHGWLLDTSSDTWIRIPRLLRGRDAQSRTVVAAGRRLFAFGGTEWKGSDYRLLDAAWTWTPP